MNNARNKADARSRVNAKSPDEIKSAKKRLAKSVRAFWKEYFERYPDYEGNAKMNRLREHFSEGGR